MDYPLDALDVRILDLLQRDATLPIADIAERVASSKTVVWRRIQKLVDGGVIRSRVAILDHRKVGLGVMVIAHVKMARHGRDVLPKFLDAIKLFPQVIECHTLMGDVDFLLKILVKSVEDYEQFFWQKLSKIDGVQEISSSISMSQTVNTTRLPLQPAD
ncbi:MAG: Lrp/AsnC family transcriptional regulator [Gammaproteobacteria bacterium]